MDKKNEDSSFKYLRAIPDYARYWYHESMSTPPTQLIPTRHPYRTVFASDRDRIIYSSAFRRMSSKTQVFASNTADNLRTRLTHTLEVSQIARTIAIELGLDEYLTEAIALGHDLGHTPFGHVGERCLNQFSNGEDKTYKYKNNIDKRQIGFKHNQQSVRVLVEYSEKVKFTNYTLYGIREHSKRFWVKEDDVAFYNIYDQYCSLRENNTTYPAWSFEAFIVKWADEIAQRNHDLQDAYLQNIIPLNEIVTKLEPLHQLLTDDHNKNKFERLRTQVDKANRSTSDLYLSVAHTLSSFIVDAYATIVIKEMRRVIRNLCNHYNIKSDDKKNPSYFKSIYFNIDEAHVRQTMTLKNSGIARVDDDLGRQLKNSVVDSYKVKRMDGKGEFIIKKLLRAYLSNPQQLPNSVIERFVCMELIRSLTDQEHAMVMTYLSDNSDNKKANVNTWLNYEYREALRLMKDSKDIERIVYPALSRVIIDYIAGMTDSYALSQYRELY